MWRNLLSFALLVVAFSPLSVAAQSSRLNKHHNKIIAAVRGVLDAQVAAWNRGEIEGYMAGYWRSDKTVFVSGDNVTHGWQTVFEHYKKSYNTRDKMGTLTFSELEITPVGNDSAIALGRWQLQRAKDEPHGRFTLIFRRTKQGWRIIHDHTSSAS